MGEGEQEIAAGTSAVVSNKEFAFSLSSREFSRPSTLFQPPPFSEKVVRPGREEGHTHTERETEREREREKEGP